MPVLLTRMSGLYSRSRGSYRFYALNLDYVTDHNAVEFIVATEQHIIHQMVKAAPHKTFIAALARTAPVIVRLSFMAMNSLEKLYLAMVNEAPRVELPEDLRIKTLTPLQKILNMSPAPHPNRDAA